MSDDLRKQVYDNLVLKETEELVAIWQANNRAVWSDVAFEVMKTILQERLEEIPPQGEPIFEEDDEDEHDIDEVNLEDWELKIIEDENPPAFYSPMDVVKLVRWIEMAAKATVVLVALYNFRYFSTFQRIFEGYFVNVQGAGPVIFVLSLTLTVINALIGMVISYFALRMFAQILRILMEMEFNSRKAK